MQIHTQTMNPDSKINNTQHISSLIVYVSQYSVMNDQYALYSVLNASESTLKLIYKLIMESITFQNS